MIGAVLLLVALVSYMNQFEDTSRLTVMYPQVSEAEKVLQVELHAPLQVRRFGFDFSGVR